MTGAVSLKPPRDLIAVCPYCFKEYDTDVVNAAGECPTVNCCGENHCYAKYGPLDTEDENENF